MSSYGARQRVLAGLAVGCGALVLGCSPAAEPEQAAEKPGQSGPAVPPPTPTAGDVPGLPALFPEGLEHPTSDLSLDEYFARFGGASVLNPETREVRPEVVSEIHEVMSGKQVTWDGYVQRVKNAPSGRVTLILAMTPKPTVDTAMVRFAAGWNDLLHSYEPGDRVRVVAVFDKIVAVFPSLRGISVEEIPATEG